MTQGVVTPKPGSGYSVTPLAKKLGFKPGMCVFTRGAPQEYLDLLQPLPSGIEFVKTPSSRVDMAHVFESERAALEKALARLRKTMNPECAVWVSWPKKASKVPTDITEDGIRSIALPMGYVDIKVCAVNAIWSGLKLVVRRDLRDH